MDANLVLSLITVIVAVLTVMLSIVTGYVTYLSITLKRSLRESLRKELTERVDDISGKTKARMLLLDLALESFISLRDAGASPNGGRDQQYFIQNIHRLIDDDQEQVRLALTAIEAAGTSVAPLLAYVERIRNCSNWSATNCNHFDKILRDAQRNVIASHAVAP